MNPTIEPAPERSSARAARLVARAIKELAFFAGTLLVVWALYAYVLPFFGVNT
ncbi:MAG: hypothetical protein ACYC7A_17730 [Thermoanaerobaculia bacterium]